MFPALSLRAFARKKRLAIQGAAKVFGIAREALCPELPAFARHGLFTVRPSPLLYLDFSIVGKSYLGTTFPGLCATVT